MPDDRDAEPSTDLSVEANDLEFECLRAGDGDRLALCLNGFPDDAGSMSRRFELRRSSPTATGTAVSTR